MLLPIYPETTRQVFDMIDKKLGHSYTYASLSGLILSEIKLKYKMTPVQLITFGFICPDHEF